MRLVICTAAETTAVAQRADAYDAQDVSLGMDEPYIEYCGKEFSWYGHMHAVILHPNRLSVQMDAEAAMQMTTMARSTWASASRQSATPSCSKRCSTTFAGCDYYREER